MEPESDVFTLPHFRDYLFIIIKRKKICLNNSKRQLLRTRFRTIRNNNLEFLIRKVFLIHLHQVAGNSPLKRVKILSNKCYADHLIITAPRTIVG